MGQVLDVVPNHVGIERGEITLEADVPRAAGGTGCRPLPRAVTSADVTAVEGPPGLRLPLRDVLGRFPVALLDAVR